MSQRCDSGSPGRAVLCSITKARKHEKNPAVPTPCIFDAEAGSGLLEGL
jgi:hypothetical protein